MRCTVTCGKYHVGVKLHNVSNQCTVYNIFVKIAQNTRSVAVRSDPVKLDFACTTRVWNTTKAKYQSGGELQKTWMLASVTQHFWALQRSMVVPKDNVQFGKIHFSGKLRGLDEQFVILTETDFGFGCIFSQHEWPAPLFIYKRPSKLNLIWCLNQFYKKNMKSIFLCSIFSSKDHAVIDRSRALILVKQCFRPLVAPVGHSIPGGPFWSVPSIVIPYYTPYHWIWLCTIPSCTKFCPL